MSYYLAKHIPLVGRLSGAVLKKVGRGGSGAFEPHAAEITGDIPNDTNIRPTIQISEGKLF